jgi:hypothetical protein
MSNYNIPNYNENQLQATIARYSKLTPHLGKVKAGSYVLIGVRNDIDPKNSDGTVNQQNDKLFLARKESNGRLSIVRVYSNFNTDPSQSYLDNPIDGKSGAAVLVPSTVSGFGYDYKIGTHIGVSTGPQDALEEDADGYVSRVWRVKGEINYNKGAYETGYHAINFHSNFGAPYGNGISAGCQTMPNEDKLDLLSRMKDNGQQKIKYFLLNASTVNQNLNNSVSKNYESPNQNDGAYKNNSSSSNTHNANLTQEQLLVYEKAIQALVFFLQMAHAYKDTDYVGKNVVQNIYESLLGMRSEGNLRGIHVLARMIVGSDRFQNSESLTPEYMMNLCITMAGLSRGLITSKVVLNKLGISGYVQQNNGESIYADEIYNVLTAERNPYIPSAFLLRSIPSPESVKHILRKSANSRTQANSGIRQ